ncbi:MAG: flagellar protein G, partial [Thermoplasmata archaeon]|nr:flagellar protein G [Thermoplasmata archaeon]
MGASTASTQMIFFISALLVSSIVVAVATRSVYDIAGGIDDRSGIVEDQLATDIQIINDPSVVPNDPVLIYIKNVGKVTL